MLLATGFISGHYLTHSSVSGRGMPESVTKVTNFSSPAMSVTYYEPRILFYETASNPAYPQMQTINKMDLVYAQ